MWLIRVILVMIIFWFIVMLIGWMIRQALVRKLQSFQAKANRQPPEDKQKALVPCESCGIYIEQDKAIYQHGKYYCSKEHT